MLAQPLLRVVILSTALFGPLALAAFPGGPYTIWSAANQVIHMDSVIVPGNEIRAEGYVNGRLNQYWQPEPASSGTTTVYYIHSNVSGSVYANGAAGAGLNARAYASPWLFTPVAGTTDQYTITVPESTMAITSTNTTGVQLHLQPLVPGNVLQRWGLTDHGPPSSVSAPA